ncbi:MAG: ERF family protein [Clostridium sp.]|uniref:ERF family protein n=1 Tax=Clostridium sp. TaxID=1506 RepID=UPI002908116F|nr:ERF family protein [Clostridium sp.]MDU7339318.1 ERF family protein [Clostridium sp.]
MKITEQLSEVQAKLKAPKNQKNSFGNYNYRSCEDILEAVKPLLKENSLVLTLCDSVEIIGARIYVKATARLQNADGESIENSAYAREAESKKGMDDSQITGTASSYARKYALNGMFLIDDTKDADTDEHSRQQHKPLKCSRCGGDIKAMRYKGVDLTPQEAADKFGICLDCIKSGVSQ